MTRPPRTLVLAGLCGLALAAPARAQDAPGDVLTRGPVHEAYAGSHEMPTAPPAVPKAPPEPIEELPPDQKPEGDNVLWIPGYWSWDEERADFIWISGFWRASPPGQLWVPGSWRQSAAGYQWASGFWQETHPISTTVQPQAATAPEIQYLPPPPATIEAGPAIPATDPTSVYVPGSWVWRGRYVWRPGVWIAYRPGWIWVPAHFRWSPVGYVFVDGYWDYPLARRGVIFAPMYFPPAVVVRPGFVYTPTYVISEPAMVGAMFVRRGYGVYYFGDYFGPTYASGGYVAWCSPGLRVGVTVGVGRGYFYDPLWSYYSVTYRSNPTWQVNVTNVYVGRFQGTIAPPPRTLVQQNTVINNITNVTNVTNVTNNVTVVNNNVTRNVMVNNHDVTNVAMVAPVKVAAQLQPEAKVVHVPPAVQQAEARHAAEVRQVAVRRQAVEAQVARQNPPQPGVARQPVTAKLEVPHAMVARAQVPVNTPAHQAPPPPAVPKANPAATPPHPAAVTPHPTTPVTPVTPKGPATPTTPAHPMTVVPPKTTPAPATPAPVPPKTGTVPATPPTTAPHEVPQPPTRPTTPVPPPKNPPKKDEKPHPKP